MKLSLFNKKNITYYDLDLPRDPDLDAILKGEMTIATICQDIVDLTSSELCSVVLISVDKPFNIVYSTNPSISFCQDMPLLSINDEIIISNNFRGDPRNENFPISNCPLRKILSVPIIDNSTIYGKIILANRRKGYSYNTFEMIRKQIGYICSIIISNDDNIIFNNCKSNSQVTFLSSLSHEIRTPIHGIVNMISLLSSVGDLNEKQKQYISCALSSCEDLVETVSDSIDYQKIKNNSLAIVNDSFDLVEMMAKTIDIVKFKADQKGVKLDLIIGSDVPKIVYGDKDRIRQVLLNIIGNAIKFTTVGSITIKVDQYPSRIIFSIKDTGCGIKKENIPKIFIEYFQEEKYSKNGLGLGLSLSKKLIQMMGGGISVESTVGVGSTFTIDLPLAEERYYLDFSSDDDREMAILIIDPVENNRIILRKFIRQWKINVVAVATYKEGKRLLDDDEYDIIIINPSFNIAESFAICHFIQDKYKSSRIVCIGSQKSDLFDGYIPDVGAKSQVYNLILSVKKTKPTTPAEYIEMVNYRVCIVEDDDVSAFALKEILIRHGIDEKNIICIDNGEYAVRNITHNRYDIIFMDCKLKGDMDGIKVTQIVKSSLSHIKIIGMTASITEDEKITWLNCGLDGMIIKPFSAEAIYKLL